MVDSSDMVGRRLQSVRDMLGVSQNDLAEVLGFCRSHIGSLEQGRFEGGAKTLRTISETLGITSDWLLGLSDTPPNPKKVRASFEAAKRAKGL